MNNFEASDITERQEKEQKKRIHFENIDSPNTMLSNKSGLNYLTQCINYTEPEWIDTNDPNDKDAAATQ